jgi:periplasmic protein TonB
MSVTWSPRADAKPTLRLRLISLSVAGLACASLTYVAVTQQFGVIADLIDDGGAIETIIEKRDPPPEPPVVPDIEEPLPPMSTTFDETAPPTDYAFAVEPIPPRPSSMLTNATFLERPNARDFARYFPPRALDRGVSGRVVLDCLVDAGGRLACSVESETPTGWGFGDASLRAAQHFRVAAATADGRPTSDGRLRVPLTWRAE